MKFAIRDDDTSFFTNPSDLENAYDFVGKGKISLSVVPFTYPNHKDVVFPYGLDIQPGYYGIGNNEELISYLISHKDRYDFLLHGYSHEYQKNIENRRARGTTPDKGWFPEMIWKSEKRLEKEIEDGLNYLNNLLDTNISVFVAPNNIINNKGIRVIEKNCLNYSGIIQFADRDFSFKYAVNFIIRWGYRLIYKIPYAKVFDYGKHYELVAYALDNYDRLKYEYNKCKKSNVPFVIYTHYWSLLRDPVAKERLKEIYNYVIDDGAELVGLSECFE